jgi:hypothetical protein
MKIKVEKNRTGSGYFVREYYDDSDYRNTLAFCFTKWGAKRIALRVSRPAEVVYEIGDKS